MVRRKVVPTGAAARGLGRRGVVKCLGVLVFRGLGFGFRG